jgi:hypothetical protein
MILYDETTTLVIRFNLRACTMCVDFEMTAKSDSIQCESWVQTL